MGKKSNKKIIRVKNTNFSSTLTLIHFGLCCTFKMFFFIRNRIFKQKEENSLHPKAEKALL